jgi:DNA polymerase III delta prime subunit
MTLLANPDVIELSVETLSVDDARKLKQQASTKPLGKEKIFILSCNFLGREAQNALLKVLEEPVADTYFFILVSSSEVLLPTVRSRVMIISLGGKSSEGIIPAKKFLKESAEGRLKLLSTFLSHESESKKSDLIHFLNSIELELAEHKEKKEVQEGLKNLLMYKQYLFDQSPSIKMIAEFLALTLPLV